MKKINIKLTAIIPLSYDENSKEFIEAYESYKEIINPKSTIEDMLQHIAWYVVSYSPSSFIEGVGQVSVDGRKRGDEGDWCGVDICSSAFTANDVPEFESEID